MTAVVVSGKRVVVSDRDVLGAGGEATVHALADGRVLKLFHTPTQLHREKVRALISLAGRLPGEVVVPDAEIEDEAGAFVGYVMPRVAAGFTPLCELLRRPSFVTVELPARLAAWRALSRAVAALHRAGVVVGDLSDQNVFVDVATSAVRIIDADSFQIGQLPCEVQTDTYADPLAPVGAALTTEHDVYALHVLAVRLLLGVHPYGGTHPSHGTIAARAKAGLFVADPGVAYPSRVAQPPLVIGRTLLAALGDFFRATPRIAVDAQVFEATLASTRRCASCGKSAVLDAGVCPHCAVRAATSKPGERADDGLEVDHTLVWVDGVGDTLVALEHTPEGAVVHVCVGGRWRRVPVGATAPLACVLLSERRLAIACATEIDVWDLTTLAIVASTTTELSWGGPVIGRLGDALVRSASGRLLAGGVVLGRPVERLLGDVVRGQTRLFSSAPSSARLLAATRLGRQTMVERFDAKGRTTLPLPSLELGEALTDLDVLDDGSSTLCLRQVRLAGVSLVRQDLFGARGNLVASSRVAAALHPTRDGVRGRAFQGAVVLHPTAAGLVREAIVHGGLGDLSPIDGTASFVDEASHLAMTSRGLAAATSNTLHILRPKR